MEQMDQWSDRAVLAKLERRGLLQPTQVFLVEYCFYLTSAESADRVAALLQADGFTTSTPEKWGEPGPGEPQEWEMFATRAETLSGESVRAARSRFEALMRDEGGDYDGWDARPLWMAGRLPRTAEEPDPAQSGSSGSSPEVTAM